MNYFIYQLPAPYQILNSRNHTVLVWLNVQRTIIILFYFKLKKLCSHLLSLVDGTLRIYCSAKKIGVNLKGVNAAVKREPQRNAVGKV